MNIRHIYDWEVCYKTGSKDNDLLLKLKDINTNRGGSQTELVRTGLKQSRPGGGVFSAAKMVIRSRCVRNEEYGAGFVIVGVITNVSAKTIETTDPISN
jgi:hypothetical protein